MDVMKRKWHVDVPFFLHTFLIVLADMHRLYVSPEHVEAGRVILRGEAFRKVRTVLRMKPKDTLLVFDGQGSEYQCQIISFSSGESELLILRKDQPLREPPREIHLGQALPKSDKMAFIIQKAVELGVSAVHPVMTARSIPRYDITHLDHKVRRWQKIALEAAQQSGRMIIPEVRAAVPLDHLLQFPPPTSLKIILHHGVTASSIKSIVRNNHDAQPVFFLVGPEGGFAPEEISLAERHGFVPVSLGARTLRTETVALVFLSIIQYELGDID